MTDIGGLNSGDQVEIMVDSKWVPATFHAADSIFNAVEELSWLHHFVLEDGSTIPADIHSGGELPPWRRVTSRAR